MINITAVLILIFFAITYIQSGYEKFSDWRENVNWLRGHFSECFLKNYVSVSLVILLIMEMLSAALCIVGIIELFDNITSHYALYAAVFSSVTLLIMLLGQRLAKDYDGARTVVIYFIPAIIAIYILQE